jgi:hypothetical protein
MQPIKMMTNDKLPTTGNRDVPRQRYSMPAALLVALVFACFFHGANQAHAQEQKTKVIYFLSGLKDHPAGVGRHEVAKDMLVLQDCINKATNIKGVKIVTKYIDARSALDVEDIKDAAAIIVEASSASSSQQRTHPIFPPLAPGVKKYDQQTLDYLAKLDALHQAGMGIMMLHWGIAVNNEQNPMARNYYMKWFGESAMEGYTQNPLGFWVVTPIQGAKHPILNGVHRWIYKDEIFSHLVVNPGDPYRTDLLTGESPETNQTEFGSPKGVITPRGIASAYEKGSERGILWGGQDFHSALLNDDYRRFVLNAIIWTAGIEVPKGGVKTSATELQLVPISKQFDQYKRPDGYVEPKLPDGYVLPPQDPVVPRRPRAQVAAPTAPVATPPSLVAAPATPVAAPPAQ